MRNRERTVNTTSTTRQRGLWCNLCGTRLERGASLGLLPARHKVEWREATGRASTWSLCVQCYAEKLRCASCGLQVGSQAFMLEGETRIYCRHCFEQRPRCDTCGAPVGAHYWTRPDGRKLCDRCQSTAVSDPAHAHSLYKQVRSALARTLGMTLREPCQLKLVNRRQLHELIEKSSLHSLDADSRGRCFGLFIREGMHRAVFVEYGLPQIVLLEVMTHEYAHAWQSENCNSESTPEIQEGFAEWVSYKLLQSWGCTRRSERMLRRDDIYGRGLKKMLQWEREGGIAEVFRRAV
ncbi:MAG: protein DA1 [Chloroflexota bacterium]